MSTLKTTNISHPNSAANDIVLDANGSVNVDSGTVYVDATNNRVGVGTTTPTTKLDIYTGSATGTYVKVENTEGRLFAGVYGTGEGYLATETSDPLILGTNGTERARIDTSGRLLVGTSSSLNAGSSIQSYKASGTNTVWIQSASLGNGEAASLTATSDSRFGEVGVYKHAGIANPAGYLGLQEQDGSNAFYWTDNSANFRISSNASHIGTTSGTVVGTQTSDERIKNILGPVEYGLSTIKQIEPVRYTLKSEPESKKLGFIAQQVFPLVPESVFDTHEHIQGEPEDAPTKLGMEYVALIPVLVNAIKELSAEVDALKTQLQAQ